MIELKQGQWLRIAGVNVVLIEDKENATNSKQKDGVREENKCSFWHDGNERAKPTVKTAPSCEPLTPRGRSASRKRNFRGRSPSGKTNRQQCRDSLKGTCTLLPCDDWHLPECQFCKTEIRM